MTSLFFVRRRLARIRCGFAVAFVPFAAIVGHCSADVGERAAAVLIVVACLQLLSATLSLGLAVVAGILFNWREALAEVGVGVLTLLSIFAAIAAAIFFAPGVLE